MTLQMSFLHLSLDDPRPNHPNELTNLNPNSNLDLVEPGFNPQRVL